MHDFDLQARTLPAGVKSPCRYRQLCFSCMQLLHTLHVFLILLHHLTRCGVSKQYVLFHFLSLASTARHTFFISGT